VIILEIHSGHILLNLVRIPLVVLSQTGITGEIVQGFRLAKLLDRLGQNFVIILDMHSGEIFPNLVRIPLVVLCQIQITGNL